MDAQNSRTSSALAASAASPASSNSDELIVIPVERIVKDVRRCVDANISVAGLSLALTIPDVLGQECYPELVNSDGERKVRAQYKAWFDAWVGREFMDKERWFTGDMCYDLRCAMLHAGRADISYYHRENRGVDYRYTFKLVDDGPQMHHEHRESGGRVIACEVHVNADVLATALADGAQACLNSMA